MIGLDTNILARLILEDHQAQTAKAQKAIADGNQYFVSIIVLSELVWLLGSRYGYQSKHLGEVIEMLAYNDDLFLEDWEIVVEALEIFKTAKADFPDILIALRNRQAGCATTLTFDKQAAKLDDYTLLR